MQIWGGTRIVASEKEGDAEVPARIQVIRIELQNGFVLTYGLLRLALAEEFLGLAGMGFDLLLCGGWRSGLRKGCGRNAQRHAKNCLTTHAY
jgi:hypothetical protein